MFCNLFVGDQPGQIRDHLIEDIDYVFLPKEAWDMLHSIYGITEGQEPIIRNIVENGLYVKLCQVSDRLSDQWNSKQNLCHRLLDYK